jgi:hypothetical protein
MEELMNDSVELAVSGSASALTTRPDIAWEGSAAAVMIPLIPVLVRSSLLLATRDCGASESIVACSVKPSRPAGMKFTVLPRPEGAFNQRSVKAECWAHS